VLVLFPITSQPFSPDRFAADIPELEKRRAGLDASLLLWIISTNIIRTRSAGHLISSQSRRSADSARRSFFH